MDLIDAQFSFVDGSLINRVRLCQINQVTATKVTDIDQHDHLIIIMTIQT